MQSTYINLISYYNKDNVKINDLAGNPYQTNVTQNRYPTYVNTFNNNINQIDYRLLSNDINVFH